MICVVRDSLEDDMAGVHSIYSYYVLHSAATFEEEPPPVEELTRRRADALGRGLPHLVAEVDRLIAGFSYATPYRSRSAYRFTVEDSVYVDHSLSRRGIGRNLLSALIARCEKGELHQMVAVIGDGDNAASIALHEHLGFRPAGTLRAVGYKFGRWVDTVLMQRALGAGFVTAGSLTRQARSKSGACGFVPDTSD
jgi:phosphinothricin acetyltransferase